MDRLWSPWRYQYVTTKLPGASCVFCEKPTENRDRENYIVFRGARNYVLLNLYPYTNGHVMVAPYEHVATLEETDDETASEMMTLTKSVEGALRKVYRPDGINLGMNIGACAGAGVAGHLHMHILPRWLGDANFLTTVAETRVMPEALEETWRKLAFVLSDRYDSSEQKL